MSYISRKECPSCGEVEYKHIMRNTQTKKWPWCKTPKDAQDVGWEYCNPVMESYKGNQWSNFLDMRISTIFKLDARYADEIMELWPKNDQEYISSSKYEVLN